MISSIRLSSSSPCIATPRKEKSGKSPLFQDFSTCDRAWQAIRAPQARGRRSTSGQELAKGRDDLGARHASLLARAPGPDLHEAALDPGVADRDPQGDAEQVRVVELHAG